MEWMQGQVALSSESTHLVVVKELVRVAGAAAVAMLEVLAAPTPNVHTFSGHALTGS